LNAAKRRAVFLCTHNSARSQMAEGLLRHRKGEIYDVQSAGTHPIQVDADAVQVMAEIGIDISSQRSKGLEELEGTGFDLAVTVCDRAAEACPILPGARRRVHRSFDDPAAYEGALRLPAFRRVRDEMRAWIENEF